MPGNYNTQYAVDMVLVIDATGSMKPLIDKVKDNALRLYDDVATRMNEKGKHIDQLRVKIVIFRDYLADGKEAMLETRFYDLPKESTQFETVLRGVVAKGGGDDPEDGLEAVACAMKSDWTKAGSKQRHVIVVWTDTGTHELGYGRSAANYPKGMPGSFDALTEMWGDEYETGVMDQNAKRMVIFAPDEPGWTTISDTWDLVVHVTAPAGEGLDSLGYSQMIDAVVQSAS